MLNLYAVGDSVMETIGIEEPTKIRTRIRTITNKGEYITDTGRHYDACGMRKTAGTKVCDSLNPYRSIVAMVYFGSYGTGLVILPDGTKLKAEKMEMKMTATTKPGRNKNR